MIQFNDKILDQLDSNEYWVLSHLAKRCNNNMSCFPSTETLMSDCKMGKSSVQATINGLVKKNIISKKQQVVNGKLSSNVYTIISKMVGKYTKPLTELPLTENQPTVNLPLTELPLTENQPTKVLITSLESINHSFETTTTGENENFEKIENEEKAAFPAAEDSVEKMLSTLDCIEMVKNYFDTDQGMKDLCVMTAKFTEGKDGNFEEEIRKFCIHNATRFEFLYNPIKGMPHIFTKWLSHAKIYNRPKTSESKNYSSTNYQNYQNVKQQVRTGSFISDFSKY